MDDFYNAVETATVATINGDPWLGLTSNIKEVQAKMTDDGDNRPLYDAEKVPAIYVECMGERQSPDIETVTERGIRLNVFVEVVHYTGDLKTGKTLVREIAARLSQLISRQQSDLRFPAQASQLNGFAEGGLVEYPNDVVFGSGPQNDGWLVLAMIRFYVRIFDPN